MTKRESSLLWSLERGLGIALQAVLEKKAVTLGSSPALPPNTLVNSPIPIQEKAMAPHSSTLAWKVPWMEEPGGLQSIGSLRVRYD